MTPIDLLVGLVGTLCSAGLILGIILVLVMLANPRGPRG